jgi:hypothetical protein
MSYGEDLNSVATVLAYVKQQRDATATDVLFTVQDVARTSCKEMKERKLRSK